MAMSQSRATNRETLSVIVYYARAAPERRLGGTFCPLFRLTAIGRRSVEILRLLEFSDLDWLVVGATNFLLFLLKLKIVTDNCRNFHSLFIYSARLISHVMSSKSLIEGLLSARCNVIRLCVRCEKIEHISMFSKGSRALFTDFRGTSQFQVRSIGNRLLPTLCKFSSELFLERHQVNLKRSIQSRVTARSN